MDNPNFSALVTKADLAATKADLEKSIDSTRVHFENLLSDQTNVILEAVDERMDRKFDEKLHPVLNKLDYLIGSIEDLKQENTVGAKQLREHTDKLEDHENRLAALEA